MVIGVAGLVQVSLRIPDGDWEQFHRVHGRDAAEAIRGFIGWSLHRPGAAEPSRPADQAAGPAVPAAVIEEFCAWYLRQPGAELPRRPGGGTGGKMVRLPRGEWAEFRELHGGKASEAVRAFIGWSLHRPGAELPMRLPDPPPR